MTGSECIDRFGVDEVRPSSIADWFDCPQRWMFKHVERLPFAMTPNMLRGRAIHSGVQARHDTVGGQLQLGLPFAERDEPSLDYLRQVASQEFDTGAQEIEDWRSDDPGKVKDLAIGGLDYYIVERASFLEPLVEEGRAFVEVACECTFKDLPPIRGRIDLVLKGANGVTPPLDLKTRSRRPTGFEAMKSVQLLTYDCAVWQASE